MTTAFAARKAKGTALEIEIDDYLISNGIKFIRTSFEDHYSEDEVNILVLDPLAAPVRMIPDRYLPYHSIFLEVSNSKIIERKKYNYLYHNFKDCYIVSKDDTLFCAKVSDITFEKPMTRCWGLPFDVPIEDTFWRNPELLSDYEYHLFMKEAVKRNRPTSGKASAFIDWKQSNAIHINDLLIHG